jgi:hypothetical protein
VFFARRMDVHTSGVVDRRTDLQSRFTAQKFLFFFGHGRRTQFLRRFFSGGEEQSRDCFSRTLTQWPATEMTVQIFEKDARRIFENVSSLISTIHETR